jgi:type 1 fimbria pilin
MYSNSQNDRSSVTLRKQCKVSLMSNCNLCGIVVFLMLSYASSAQAWSQGEVAPIGGTHMYDINLETMDISNNVVGGTIPKSWDLGGNFSVTEYCTKAIYDARYYSTTSTMAPSTSNLGYYRLNEYFDVKVEVWIAGNRSEYVTSPFTDESNRYREICKPPSSRFNNVRSGSKGKITFLITKPILNGIALADHELLKVFGRRGLLSAGVLSDEALSTINIRSGIITVPDKCIINQGTPINVEFGTIPNTSEKLNGNNYVQQVPIQVQCKGGSFETGALNIKLGIQPAGSGVASFNSDYLGTNGANDRRDLGIVIKDSSGSTVVPNQFYDVPGFNNNQGVWNLTSAPIAKPGSTIPEGEFDAAATVVAQFQ